MVLTFVGDKLDVNIFLAAIFVFITRIFNNFSSIRRLLITRVENKKEQKEQAEKEASNWRN